MSAIIYITRNRRKQNEIWVVGRQLNVISIVISTRRYQKALNRALGAIIDANIKSMFKWYNIIMFLFVIRLSKTISKTHLYHPSDLIDGTGRYHWCRSLAAANSSIDFGPGCCAPRLLHVTLVGEMSRRIVFYC